MSSAFSSKSEEAPGLRSADEVTPLTMQDVIWVLQKLTKSLKDLLLMGLRGDPSTAIRNVAGYVAWVIVMTWLAGHFAGTVIRKKLCQLPFARLSRYCSR